MSVRITGTVMADAFHYTSTGGHALLIVRVQPDAGDAVEVRHPRGTGYAAQVSSATCAQQMRAGSRVTVHCQGVALHTLPLGLRACGVDLIEIHPTAATTQEG